MSGRLTNEKKQRVANLSGTDNLSVEFDLLNSIRVSIT